MKTTFYPFLPHRIPLLNAAFSPCREVEGGLLEGKGEGSTTLLQDVLLLSHNVSSFLGIQASLFVHKSSFPTDNLL